LFGVNAFFKKQLELSLVVIVGVVVVSVSVRFGLILVPWV